MVSSHKDHKIRVFDVSEGRCIARMEGHPRTPFCIKVHPQRPNVLASACYDGCVKVWVWEGGEQNTEDRGEMVFRNPTFEQRVEGGAVSSINFVAGATIDDDAVIITCSGQVLWWRYGEPGAQAQPVNYSNREELANQKVALARIVKVKDRSLLLVAVLPFLLMGTLTPRSAQTVRQNSSLRLRRVRYPCRCHWQPCHNLERTRLRNRGRALCKLCRHRVADAASLRRGVHAAQLLAKVDTGARTHGWKTKSGILFTPRPAAAEKVPPRAWANSCCAEHLSILCSGA